MWERKEAWRLPVVCFSQKRKAADVCRLKMTELIKNLSLSRTSADLDDTLRSWVHCGSEMYNKTQISHFHVNLNAASDLSAWEPPWCFLLSWVTTCLLLGGAASLQHCLSPAHTEQGTVGEDEWSAFALRDFKTFSQKVRTNQWERPVEPHSGRVSPWWGEDKNTRVECDWPEKHDVSRVLFPPCSALFSLESTNHRTILIPAATAGLDGKRCFLFVYAFF